MKVDRIPSGYSKAWGIVYAIYPPFLRVLEKLRFHSGRQPFVLGTLNVAYTQDDLRKLLEAAGFEHALLAWRDSGEVLGMRKVDQRRFQWHIRLHDDGEIRGHYEYSPEANPLLHVITPTLTIFEPEKEYFVSLLGNYLVQPEKQ